MQQERVYILLKIITSRFQKTKGMKNAQFKGIRSPGAICDTQMKMVLLYAFFDHWFLIAHSSKLGGANVIS